MDSVAFVLAAILLKGLFAVPYVIETVSLLAMMSAELNSYYSAHFAGIGYCLGWKMSRKRRISFNGREMGLGLASSSLLLHLLLLMSVHGSESRQSLKFHTRNEDEIIQLPRSNSEVIKDGINGHKKVDDHHGTNTEHVHSHQRSHMDHMDPSEMLFFTMEDLIVGKKMPVYFRRASPSTSPHFLPREEADSIPFSLKELPDLLQFFSFSKNSPQAKAMEGTLRQCEIEPIKGETKSCTTSLESMLDFTRSVFGLDSDFSVVTTTYHGNSNITFQNYTILEVPKQILASEMVACHSMPYPYAVFYCHSQKSENKVYKISLGGENGDSVDAVAVCHMDTSQWSHDHASFRVLRIKPGTSPVCHFFPADNLIWVPAPA